MKFEKKHLIWNIIPMSLNSWSLSAILALSFNILINFGIIGALFYILGEKFKGQMYPLFTVVVIGTIVSQFLGFGGYVGVIMIFIMYAFLAKALLGMETKMALVIGFVMALIAFVGMQPAIGGVAMAGMKSAAEAFAT
jgi:hypothetical protein